MGASCLEGTIETVWTGPMAQWPNGPIRGWSTKVITGMTWKKEIKLIYDSPKYVRGEKSPWKYISKVIKTFLSS